MRDNAIPFGKDALEIIADYTRECSNPVLFNFPGGHTEVNMPLIFGKEAELKVEKEIGIVRYIS